MKTLETCIVIFIMAGIVGWLANQIMKAHHLAEHALAQRKSVECAADCHEECNGVAALSGTDRHMGRVPGECMCVCHIVKGL